MKTRLVRKHLLLVLREPWNALNLWKSGLYAFLFMMFHSVFKAIFLKYVCICFSTENEFYVVISILMDSSSPYMSPYLHRCLKSDVGRIWHSLGLCGCPCELIRFTFQVQMLTLCFSLAFYSCWTCKLFNLNTRFKMDHTVVLPQFNRNVRKTLLVDSDPAFVESHFCTVTLL